MENDKLHELLYVIDKFNSTVDKEIESELKKYILSQLTVLNTKEEIK